MLDKFEEARIKLCHIARSCCTDVSHVYPHWTTELSNLNDRPWLASARNNLQGPSMVGGRLSAQAQTLVSSPTQLRPSAQRGAEDSSGYLLICSSCPVLAHVSQGERSEILFAILAFWAFAVEAVSAEYRNLGRFFLHDSKLLKIAG